MSRTSLALAGVLAATALGGALVLWRPWASGPSGEEQVRALFEEGARAVGQKRVGDAVAGVSERFRGQGALDKAELRRVVAAHVLRGEWLAVTVTGLRVALDGGRAHASVALVAARSGRGARLADLLPQDGTGLQIAAELEREGGEWKVVTATWRQVPIAEALAGPPPAPAGRAAD